MMNEVQLDFKDVKPYVPFILLIGIGIGTFNFIVQRDFNWFQWVILASSTSFLIGFSLLWIASKKTKLRNYFRQRWKLISILTVVFFLVGTVATEVEQIIRTLVFLNEEYKPFSWSSIYFANSVISLFLGFSFFLNDRLFTKPIVKGNDNPGDPLARNIAPKVEAILKIPVKQGEGIHLIAVQDVVYFEAFDNYSYLYDAKGKKMLCDYSLIFLEKRLDPAFARIHRKYIVNTSYVSQIKPYLNGRHIIQFDSPKLDSITSSKGYSTAIRKLIKID